MHSAPTPRIGSIRPIRRYSCPSQLQWQEPDGREVLTSLSTPP